MKTIEVEKINAVITRFYKNSSEFAKAAGVSPSTISKTLRGTQDLTLKAVAFILTELKVDPEWLFNKDGETDILFKDEVNQNKYYELLEKYTSVIEEKAEWYQTRDTKKNHRDISS